MSIPADFPGSGLKSLSAESKKLLSQTKNANEAIDSGVNEFKDHINYLEGVSKLNDHLVTVTKSMASMILEDENSKMHLSNFAVLYDKLM